MMCHEWYYIAALHVTYFLPKMLFFKKSGDSIERKKALENLQYKFQNREKKEPKTAERISTKLVTQDTPR